MTIEEAKAKLDGDFWFDMHWSDEVYKTSRIPELISLLKVIQKFMEEAND